MTRDAVIKISTCYEYLASLTSKGNLESCSTGALVSQDLRATGNIALELIYKSIPEDFAQAARDTTFVSEEASNFIIQFRKAVSADSLLEVRAVSCLLVHRSPARMNSLNILNIQTV